MTNKRQKTLAWQGPFNVIARFMLYPDSLHGGTTRTVVSQSFDLGGLSEGLRV